MDDQDPKETKGVPWGDHNETASSPPDTRREDYGDADPSQNADERAADHSPERDSSDQADGSDEARTERPATDDKPVYDL